MKGLLLLMILALASSESCSTNGDCAYLFNCVNGACKHKDFLPVEGIELAGMILIILVGALTYASGFAGLGGVHLLTFMIFFNFDVHTSISLNQAIVMGGAFAHVLINIPERHPIKDRPLIDFEVVMLLVEPMCFGATIGFICSRGFPQWLIIASLTLVLTYTLWTAIQKFMALHKQRRTQRRRETARTAIEVSDQEGSPSKKNNTNSIEISEENFGGENGSLKGNFSEDAQVCPASEEAKENEESEDKPNTEDQKHLDYILNKQRKIVPYREVLFILSLYVITNVAQIIRGGNELKSPLGYEVCSVWNWVYVILFEVFLLCLNLIAGLFLLHIIKRKLRVGYDFDDMDIRWKPKTAFIASFATYIAGFDAGYLGIGGAIVVNPTLISLGIRPEGAGVISSCVAYFSFSVSTFQHLVAGVVLHDYGTMSILCAFVGTFIGVFIFQKPAQRHNRMWVLIVLLILVLATAIIGSIVFNILSANDSLDNGYEPEIKFKAFC
ncbi:unnamed protein product [Blepharisma stoltei]|uniref:Sulfite exporter TauE/SafE family protein n=1 Tax=Blepharisma stoltei TaxID=1481888 RepID=A0AAU9IMU4_9CILI|nr:unnamed protein product [Blepharisma stoltei]